MAERPRPKNVIRQLGPGEPLPPGEPGRYSDGRGYIRLRWRVGTYEYVEVYEHRLVAGVPAADVHHRDENKGNNDPANLEVLDRAAHGRELGARASARSKRITQWDGMRSQAAYDKRQSRLRRERERAEFLRRIGELYQSGLTTIEVGEIVGRDPSRVTMALKSLGIKARRPIDYAEPVDGALIRAWHSQGVRAGEMCARLKVSRRRLYQEFDRLGLPRFRPGPPRYMSEPHQPLKTRPPETDMEAVDASEGDPH